MNDWKGMTVAPVKAVAFAVSLIMAACGGGVDDAGQGSASSVGVQREDGATTASSSRVLAKGKISRARSLRGVTAMDVAPDGSMALGAADGSVQIQAENSTALRTMGDANGAATTALAFSADGKQLVSVGRDSLAKVWNVASQTRLLTLQGHEHPVRTVALSRDGKLAASAGEETRVMVWDTSNGKLSRILSGHTGFVNAVAFSPDGRWLAAGDASGSVVIWNPVSGVLRQKLLEHTDEVNSLAYSPDGRFLATAGDDGRVVLWSADSGQKLQTLVGDVAAVRTLAFSRDGGWLASAGEDSKVMIWNMSTQTLSRTLVLGNNARVNSLVFDTYKRMDTLLAGDEEGRVTRWDVARGEVR